MTEAKHCAEGGVEWLHNLKKSVDERNTIELLVNRIDAAKTEVNVKSTLSSVLGETVSHVKSGYHIIFR